MEQVLLSVPASTGTNTSPAAIIAAIVEVSFPLPCIKMLCVFSITTMASSTIIPKPNNNANSTIKFSVTCVPIIISAKGKNTNATNMLKGTDKCNKECIYYTHKKHKNNKHQHKTNNNRINKIIKRISCCFTLIAGNNNIQIFWKFCFLHIMQLQLLLHQKFQSNFHLNV